MKHERHEPRKTALRRSQLWLRTSLAAAARLMALVFLTAMIVLGVPVVVVMMLLAFILTVLFLLSWFVIHTVDLAISRIR